MVSARELVQLSPLVRRLTANNPGPLTGAGTNCYLIGCSELAILDPGPADPVHIDAILAAVADVPVRWIVVTHTHPDHSPAAAILAQKTGAALVGSVLQDDPHQDASFVLPGSNLCHGDLIVGEGFTLEAIATPGHVANHFCYWLREEGAVFTGDHIMGGSTVVIVPPAGDMADYVASLAKLKQYPISSLLPGHGDVIREPESVIDGLIAHRRMRENKVLQVLGRSGGSIASLTPAVYDDVDPSLHPIAQVSLWAHLLKLEKDGVVCGTDGESGDVFSVRHWSLVKGAT